MMGSFDGKVVLITGGTSGIGRSTAVAFGKEGAAVVVTGRREAEGAETVRQVEAVGAKALFIQGDVQVAADVEKMVSTTVAKFGAVDIAFNNAGVEDPAAPFHLQAESTYDRGFGVNVKGLWLSMQAEIKQMLIQGKGSIINTTSVAGVIGFSYNGVYTATKHAVIGFTKTAALEYAKQGIRVNAVAPGAIETDMINRFASDDATRQMILSMHPMGRMGHPDEIASAVLWLASDGAGFVTGTTLFVDGGFTAS